MMENKQWGYLRETQAKAQQGENDHDTGLHKTGLDEYLKVIFPEIDDWIHNKGMTSYDKNSKTRPDYRSNKLRMIIEFDGIFHYTNPATIRKDEEKTKTYTNLGFKVVRIPYFIQLTNKAVETLFGVKCSTELFDPKIPSMGIKGENTPAFLCPAGVARMAREFVPFPEQYEVNLKALKAMDDDLLTGVSILEAEYNRAKKNLL